MSSEKEFLQITCCVRSEKIYNDPMPHKNDLRKKQNKRGVSSVQAPPQAKPSGRTIGYRKKKNTGHHKGLFGYPPYPESPLWIQRKFELDSLSTSDRLLHRLAEVIPQIVWTADPNGYQDFFNLRWFEYTGFTEEETYTGKTALHPDDFSVYVEYWSKALSSGKAYESEYRFRRRDGVYRWHLVRGLPIRDEEGEIIKWLGTFTDIDDEKKVQEKMRKMNEELEQSVAERTKQLELANVELENEIRERERIEEQDQANLALLQTIIDTMPTGALILGQNGKIFQLNDGLCRIFNIVDTPKQWRSQPKERFLQAIEKELSKPAEFIQTFLTALNSDASSMEEEILLQNGRFLLQDFFPIIIGNKTKGSLFLYRDVTQERRIDSSKSEFMSLASHQLRTPLTSMRWGLSRIQRSLGKRMEEDELAVIELCRHAVLRMSQTIATMLAISRVESQAQRLRAQTIGLQALFHTLREQYEDHYTRKSQRFIVRCPALLSLHTDGSILTEILQNLLMNAIKYTADGGSITLSAISRGQAMEIRVKDTGIGIPVYQQKKIFSKFFRADNVVEKDTEGTGLGLYLVSSLVRLLGGNISFTSVEGKGTTFCLLLPPAEQ